MLQMMASLLKPQGYLAYVTPTIDRTAGTMTATPEELRVVIDLLHDMLDEAHIDSSAVDSELRREGICPKCYSALTYCQCKGNRDGDEDNNEDADSDLDSEDTDSKDAGPAAYAVSAIHGMGHGSAHCWVRIATNQVGSAPAALKCSRYMCLKCDQRFNHFYDLSPDIFAAMKEVGVSADCAGASGPASAKNIAAQ